MNGISKESFLDADDSKTRDVMLYDMLEGIYEQVTFKRTFLVALIGGATAVVVMKSPPLMEALLGWLM